MNKFKLISICVLFVASLDTSAEGLYLAGEAGTTFLDIDPKYLLRDESSSSGISLGFVAGYAMKPNTVIEAAYSTTTTSLLQWSDDYQIEETRIAAGYKIPCSKTIALVPKLGVSYWNFRSEVHGFFGNTEPVTGQEQHLHGVTPFGQINLESAGPKRWRWYASATFASYDFGTAAFLSVGLALSPKEF